MDDQKRIRVMIVDDHAVVRSGLSAFLMVYDDLDFVGEAGILVIGQLEGRLGQVAFESQNHPARTQHPQVHPHRR